MPVYRPHDPATRPRAEAGPVRDPADRAFLANGLAHGDAGRIGRGFLRLPLRCMRCLGGLPLRDMRRFCAPTASLHEARCRPTAPLHQASCGPIAALLEAGYPPMSEEARAAILAPAQVLRGEGEGRARAVTPRAAIRLARGRGAAGARGDFGAETGEFAPEPCQIAPSH